ncbi:hypothetical protein LJ737_12035 [Hymenobacter sp. 15J16-1T3B]|uniref:hypothetical protein n=1 Tax=Hymenobacter sp. 15J16-1T3B TaxID=2886941 RepID=UPI001D120242|nr:hypothetical protein [Hymenobacter sp. 15J16-1T3B]MCC3157971.1 hypothetical protein [Hymenobacter sp. 15J16-1T3B]
MKTNLLLAPLAALTLLTAGCDMTSTTCEKPPQPACTSGTVLRETCMAGTLIQLDNSREGQTIQFDFDGTGVKTYHHVISTYTELDALTQPGTKLHFSLTRGGTGPELQCLAYDAPSGIPKYTLSNISTIACDDQVHTQHD